MRNRSLPAICLCLLAVLLSLAPLNLSAQDLLKGNDLSTVKVDALSDADIATFQSQLQSSGLTMAQAEQMALTKGMPQAEINKLKDRVSKSGAAPAAGTSSGATSTMSGLNRHVEKNEYKTFQRAGSPNVFGSILFTNPSLSFEPNLRIAVPSGYILGPDDELVITISGYQEGTYKVQVQPEGQIILPQVGPISVSGLTIEDATRRIKDRMAATAYPNLRSGLTQAAVTLGKIRSIHITVLGAVKPGNYTVSSFTTVFNSLFLSGGPDNLGSYRQIELLRNNKLYRKIDLYQFLSRGDQSDNITLKDNDVINIPVYTKRATISGEVKKPGTYELLPGENFETLLGFAGGFTEKAYTSRIKLKQFVESDRRIKDLPRAEYASYQPGNGDDITVDAIVEKMENSVSINGPVYRPGQYELTSGLTVGALIKKAEGLKEGVFMDRGLITRTREDLTKENIAFQLKDVMAGGVGDIQLKKRDEVRIASLTEFRNEYTVSIQGEVRKPGAVPFSANLTLKDLLFTAGGFTDAGSAYRVEIARRLNSDIASPAIDTIAEVFDINTENDLSLKGDRFLLQPMDVVTVRKKPGYLEQKTVSITGEVLYPGTYTIQSRKERISDLVKRAGGLTNLAYEQGVSLTRSYNYNPGLQQDKIDKATTIAKNIKDTSSSAVQDVSQTNSKIVVDMQQVLSQPGSKEDYILEEGDVIDIPKVDPLVKISGEIYQSTKTRFQRRASVRYYLTKAGGTTDYARLSKIYVLYPNGQVLRTHSAFWGAIRFYPRITTGAEIVVPKMRERKRTSAAEVIGLTSAFLSVTSLIIVTINAITK